MTAIPGAVLAVVRPGTPEPGTIATNAFMGLKRIPPPGFRPSATHGELGPVQVRKFLFSPRAGAGTGRAPKELPVPRRLSTALRKTGQTGARPSNSPS